MTVERRAAAEFGATAMLLTVVIGSGIMGERLAGGNAAIALLANSLATAGGLFVLIVVVAPVSGAHMNPVVTLASWADGSQPARDIAPYLAAQFAGAVAGALLAHAMFDLSLLQVGTKVRSGWGQWIGEAVATFGLLATIRGTARHGVTVVAACIGTYIGAAYWFTSSTSFANPAVTLARAMTDTFAGIRPEDVPGFVAAQLAGALAAFLVSRTGR